MRTFHWPKRALRHALLSLALMSRWPPTLPRDVERDTRWRPPALYWRYISLRATRHDASPYATAIISDYCDAIAHMMPTMMIRDEQVSPFIDKPSFKICRPRR